MYRPADILLANLSIATGRAAPDRIDVRHLDAVAAHHAQLLGQKALDGFGLADLGPIHLDASADPSAGAVEPFWVWDGAGLGLNICSTHLRLPRGLPARLVH